jgi:ADP-ribose pyrophosphatase
MKRHGPWTITDTDNVYLDPFIEVRLDQVIRPDGLAGQHVVVFMKPGVCVLAIDEQNRVHLTSEFHYGVGRESLEAVSGGIEPNENPLITAQRELQEELGLIAADWEFITTVDPFTTIVVSPTRLYLARDLTQVEQNPEGTEQIEKIVMPLEAAVEKVLSGEITHAPTCLIILRAHLMCSS